MTQLLVGDRFVRSGADLWLDLATGTHAIVSISTGRDWSDRTRACAEEEVALTTPRLLDYGPIGTMQWFEARCGERPNPDVARTDSDECRGAVDCVEHAALEPARGVQLLRLPVSSTSLAPLAGSAIARRLRARGYVTVRAGLPAARSLAPELVHRHLVILSYDDTDVELLGGWIRELVGASTRRHVLVDLRGSGSDQTRPAQSNPTEVRERASVFSARFDDAGDPRFARAVALLGRQRSAAGQRWLRAAVESGRRRGNEWLQARASRQLAAELLQDERWEAARDVLTGTLETMADRHARSDLVSLTVRVLVTLGDLDRAEALVAAAVAEAQVCGDTVPPIFNVRRAEVWFWQGRFEAAHDLLLSSAARPTDDSSPLTAEWTWWSALLAWSCGEVDAMSRAAAALAQLSMIELHDRPAASIERLTRACAVEAHLAAGDRAGALLALGARPCQASEARLEEVLLEWLRFCCRSERASDTAVQQFIRRCGARGIPRWGSGGTGMHLLQAVPALLQIVQDGEDENVILRDGCSWLRTHAAAEAAGIVTLDGLRVVASDGLAASDLGSDAMREAFRSERGRVIALPSGVIVTTPVRSAGTAIGWVVVRGRAQGAATMSEAAAALASLCVSALRTRLDAVALVEAGPSLAPEILGQSPSIGSVREAIARAAATTFAVLVEGESGTGKELAARALHRLSARRDRRFCAVNCAALTDELVEAELFGYARGAFTGAIGARAGLFEEAHGGTLFLDEVGELSPRAQAKLLRALQEREIRRLGENAPRPVDVRVIAATNRPLAEAARRSQFREDLLFRLAVVRLRLPPLRERIEDVPLLAHTFWRRLGPDAGKRALLGPDAVAALCRHGWPGNVRELQNAVASLLVLAPARGRVTARHVSQVLNGSAVVSDQICLGLDAARRGFEQRVVASALARHAGRRTAAARELGLTRQGLAKAMKRLGLSGDVGHAGVA